MKKNLYRSTSILVLFLIVIALFIHLVHRVNTPAKNTIYNGQRSKYDSKAGRQDKPIQASPGEKFMSFLPHGDFATQHEAVRNALRIALETNRTLILPQLRLGKTFEWAPFPILANYYESQDKQILKAICKDGKNDWRTDYQPCRDVNQWIDLPWSSFFDLDLIRDQFNIRIHERSASHTWGRHDALTSQLGFTLNDVVVVDPTSFPSNGSDWETMDQLKQQHKISSSGGLMNRLIPETDGLTAEERDSLKLRSPLKNIVNSEHLLQLDQSYIQFGSLVYGLRFQTSTSKQQSALQKALRSNVFVSPNQFYAVDQVAQNIVKTLGGPGAFSGIHMTMDTLARIELENQRTMKKEIAEIQGTKFKDTTKTEHKDGTPLNGNEILDQLSPKIQTELMTALVRELNGDMPINQAVSVALPLGDSLLRDSLLSSRINRRSLLSACIEYRKTVDERYPIYYLTNDVHDDIFAHSELFGPMTETFPCTFTKNDIYQWGIVNADWAKQTFNDPDVDYEKILSPIVEILVARQAYSFFEVPTTKLTRLLSWH